MQDVLRGFIVVVDSSESPLPLITASHHPSFPRQWFLHPAKYYHVKLRNSAICYGNSGVRVVEYNRIVSSNFASRRTASVMVARNIRLKHGFHYPSWRPEFTGRVDGPRTPVHFLTPVNSGRQLRCQKMHPSSRADNSVRELGPSTRVVETGLYTTCRHTSKQ